MDTKTWNELCKEIADLIAENSRLKEENFRMCQSLIKAGVILDCEKRPLKDNADREI